MGKATYENLTLDEERALYGLHHAEVRNCTFAGPADGESALKECSELLVSDCDFELRYPFWHVRSTELHNCRMTDTCRAALWYDSNIRIEDSVLGGIKALSCALQNTIAGVRMVLPQNHVGILYAGV